MPYGRRPLGLYVHVPFCVSKCEYCDFYSVTPEREAVSGYLGRVLSDLDRLLDELRSSARTEPFAETVYVGGGTPSSLGAETLGRLLAGIAERMPPGWRAREWTLEANPESFDDGIAEAAVSNGVSRVSLGVQSLEPRALAQAGRAHDRAGAIAALARALDSGLAVSCDLMAGLPGSTVDGFAEGATVLARSGIGHISCYALTVEDGTPLSRGGFSTDEDACCDSLDAAARVFRANGFERYEVSNWAKPGRESLHNRNYWRMGEWIGVGPAAVSSLWNDDGSMLRIENGKESPAAFGETRTAVPRRDAMFECVMMGLRTMEGLDTATFSARFGERVEKLLPSSLRRFPLVLADGRMRIEQTEFDRMNRILVGIMEELYGEVVGNA